MSANDLFEALQAQQFHAHCPWLATKNQGYQAPLRNFQKDVSNQESHPAAIVTNAKIIP